MIQSMLSHLAHGPERDNKNMLIFMSVFLITLFFSASMLYAECEVKLSKGQTVYVPIYSHIYIGDQEVPFDLAVTLSIRNTDMKQPVKILSADYYDSNGKLIKHYIEKPVQLNALASTRYVIKESDNSGGSGANFIVRWQSSVAISIPIIESVMIGTRMQQGISFTSRGQVISEHIE